MRNKQSKVKRMILLLSYDAKCSSQRASLDVNTGAEHRKEIEDCFVLVFVCLLSLLSGFFGFFFPRTMLTSYLFCTAFEETMTQQSDAADIV
jgi:hypothetical protein